MDPLYEEGKKPRALRAPNYSKEELNLLLSIVKEHIDVIESKKTDSSTNFMKHKTWEVISAKYNASSTRDMMFRSSKMLKYKYENWKSKQRSMVKEKSCSTTISRINNELSHESQNMLAHSSIIDNIKCEIFEPEIEYGDDLIVNPITYEESDPEDEYEQNEDTGNVTLPNTLKVVPMSILVNNALQNGSSNNFVDTFEDINKQKNKKFDSSDLINLERELLLKREERRVQQQEEKHRLELSLMRTESQKREKFMERKFQAEITGIEVKRKYELEYHEKRMQLLHQESDERLKVLKIQQNKFKC